MDSKISVNGFDVNLINKTKYDMFIYALGYENRGTHIAKVIKPHAKYNLVDSFTNKKHFDFKQNAKWYQNNQFTVIEFESGIDVEERLTVLEEYFNKQFEYKTKIKIGIDITSLSRDRIAKWLFALITLSKKYMLDIDILYSYGSYYKPNIEDVPIVHYGPVIPHFAGWTKNPDLPNSLIMGIGFEPNRAMGVWEYLESNIVYIFVPKGPSSRFDNQIYNSNATLLYQMNRPYGSYSIIEYNYNDIYKTFLKLESIVYGCKLKSRPIIIPFGPKIFAVISMLAGLIHLPDVSIWRVSGGEFEPPINRFPSGEVVGINCQLFENN